MSSRDGRLPRAIRVATADQARVVADLARARRSAGLSDTDVGRACRMSRSMVARILAGRRRASVVELAAIGSAVGLDIRMHAYPAGDPIRDAGQQRLLDRFRQLLHTSITCRTEVPLPGERDLRAWDAVISGAAWRAAVEAETVIDDVQAVERRLALKMRDGHMDVVILVVADTPRNRQALAAAPGAFSGFTRDPRQALAALRRGAGPARSTILFV